MAVQLLRQARRRRPNLIPMIDLIFILLVFFMLATRFDRQKGLPLDVAGAASSASSTEVWNGPPRLIDLHADGLTLNGVRVSDEAVIAALDPLMSQKTDPILLRADANAGMQAMVSLLTRLQSAGLRHILLVE